MSVRRNFEMGGNLTRRMIVSAFVGSPSTLAICAPLNNGCSFQTNSSAVTTFIASCAFEAGTAKLIASPAGVRSKRIGGVRLKMSERRQVSHQKITLKIQNYANFHVALCVQCQLCRGIWANS